MPVDRTVFAHQVEFPAGVFREKFRALQAKEISTTGLKVPSAVVCIFREAPPEAVAQ